MYRIAPDDPLSRRLALVGKELRESFQAMLVEHGCTIPTWAVLNYAHRMPGLSQVQLARQIGIEGPTLVRTLDRLCAEGLVERRRDEHDRRVLRVALTPAGDERWAELRHLADAMDRRLTRHLTPVQIAALNATLDSIHRALEDVHAPADIG
jgi:MarR family transcriptional regulator, transcriptional regulator for hemolysin